MQQFSLSANFQRIRKKTFLSTERGVEQGERTLQGTGVY